MALVGFSVIFVGVATFFLYWTIRFLKFRRILDKIPGPRAYFGVGNVHQFKRDPDDWFEQASGTCEMFPNPRMIRIWLTLEPYVLLYGPEEVEAILSSNKHINKSRDYNFLHPWIGLGLLTSYAEKWRPRRKLLTPTFHYEILKDFVDVFNEQAKILVQKLSPVVDKDIDMYPYMTMCALDVICQSAMGRHVCAQDNHDSDYVKAVYAINRIVHERQKKPWIWPDFMFNLFGEGKLCNWCLKVLHGFTEKVIRERYMEIKSHGGVDNLINNNATTVGGKRRLAFLDLLLDLVEKGEMPIEDVRSEVDTFMFEGHDTTSTSMNWFFHLLGCYPEIQSKVAAELDEIFGDDDRDVTLEDLSQMKYLECCIKEALRLFPSVPIYARKLEEKVNIGGYLVPAGITVGINSYMVHRDPKHWPDPEMFKPERFLPENSVGRHPYAFVPFSAGSRNCIGQRFALMEEKTILSWVLRNYHIKHVDRRDQVRPKAELILRPCKGIHVRLSSRQISDLHL